MGLARSLTREELDEKAHIRQVRLAGPSAFAFSDYYNNVVPFRLVRVADISRPPVTTNKIIATVARSFGLHISMLMSNDKSRPVLRARAALFTLIQGDDKAVGKETNTNPSVVAATRSRAKGLVLSDADFSARVQKLRAQLDA